MVVLSVILYLIWGVITLLYTKKKNQKTEHWTFYLFLSGLRGRVGFSIAFAALIVELIIYRW